MTEQKPEKKVVGRTIAIALGIICLVLVIGLVGAIADYTSMVSSRDNTISSQNSHIATNNNTISSLNSQVLNLTEIVNVQQNEGWFAYEDVTQPANSSTNLTFLANYTGYVAVWIAQLSTPNTYVRVIYSANTIYGKLNYDNQIPVSVRNTTVLFPILPASIEIRVGNTGTYLNEPATELIAITFYY
ncbi:MAG TPA: hypothetical protein VK487_00190 [Candidatus Bathyarchaeia archaeon]|nr:hypothetical protein [Candidatus Bathyarchaeia archaeon]